MSFHPQSVEQCLQCGARAPETNTNYTLISQTGWRLTRGEGADGSIIMKWHCPECWAKRKLSGDTKSRPESKSTGPSSRRKGSP
jgi:hypothetical protein